MKRRCVIGFVKSLEEIKARLDSTAKFYDAALLMVFFQTKTEVVEELLPPPLKPAAFPLGGIFIANYPKTSFCPSYLESSLFLSAQHDGEEGFFVLSMPVTNDIAMILGREIIGFPKKMAEVRLEKEGSHVHGWTQRHGIRFLEVNAKLNGVCNNAKAQKTIIRSLGSKPVFLVYNFKYFPAPERKGFDFNPQLIREIIARDLKSVEFGEAELVIRPSEYDPWDDVIIEEVLGATFSVCDITMLPGNVVAEVDPARFAPYAYMKLD